MVKLRRGVAVAGFLISAFCMIASGILIIGVILWTKINPELTLVEELGLLDEAGDGNKGVKI